MGSKGSRRDQLADAREAHSESREASVEAHEGSLEAREAAYTELMNAAQTIFAGADERDVVSDSAHHVR